MYGLPARRSEGVGDDHDQAACEDVWERRFEYESQLLFQLMLRLEVRDSVSKIVFVDKFSKDNSSTKSSFFRSLLLITISR